MLTRPNSGTSYAAPLVSGAVALLTQLGASGPDIKAILRRAAQPDTFSTDLGEEIWFRLDICRAVADVLGLAEASNRIVAESGVSTSEPPSDLYLVEPFECGTDEWVARIETPDGRTPVITDLALDPDSVLWGASFKKLYRIDSTEGIAYDVGAFGLEGVDAPGEGVNALDFAPDGSLYGAVHYMGLFGSSEPGALVRIDTTTGAATEIGSFGPDLGPAGDLAFSGTGSLFATVRESSSSGEENHLATIDTSTGEATFVNTSNSLGFKGVFGLSFVGETLFGLTTEDDNVGRLIAIDTVDGTGRYVRDLNFSAFGAASQGPSFDAQAN